MAPILLGGLEYICMCRKELVVMAVAPPKSWALVSFCFNFFFF